jgi:vacuolar-type H+-ATPase subunit E/Vma4
MEILKMIEEEGEQQARQILAQAEEEARKRREQTERELQAWREEFTKQARQEIEGEKRTLLSRARAQAREIVLRAKSEAGERLFEELVREAERLREDPKRYKKFLAQCLKEAEQEIDGPLVLQIDPRDEKIVKELLQGTPHTLGGSIETLGGLLATNERGDLLVDDRLETRIANLRQRYRAQLSVAIFQPEQLAAPAEQQA